MLIPALSMALQVASPVTGPHAGTPETGTTAHETATTETLPAQNPPVIELPTPSPTPVASPPQDPALATPVTQTETPAPQATDSTTQASAIQPDAGTIVVTGETGAPPSDPAQAINQQSYAAVQAVDDAVVAPVANVYKKGLPSPVRSGLRNFLTNLTEPVVFLNFLLQGKPGKAMETLGRFGLNTVMGVAGLVDVAKTKPFNLPRRVNGFANTLGYYGIGPGPYMFLPLVGPITVRDLIGLGLDRAMLPAVVGKPFTRPEWVLGAGTVKSLDDRVEFDCELTRMRDSSNPYNTTREFYLERRKAEIEALHGRVYRPKGYALFEITDQCVKTTAQVIPPMEEEEPAATAVPSPASAPAPTAEPVAETSTPAIGLDIAPGTTEPQAPAGATAAPGAAQAIKPVAAQVEQQAPVAEVPTPATAMP